MTKIYSIVFFCLIASLTYAQKDKVIQLSGVVTSNDTVKQFIPFAHILIKGRNQITATNEEGFFAIPALPNDTVVFSHLGFHPEKLWIPDTLEGNKYLVLVTLNWDTTMLEPVVLYPWPKDVAGIVDMKINMTEFDIAQRNLAIQALKEQAAAMGYSSDEMQDYMARVQNQNIYNQGRYYGADGGAAIVGALTNPFAWAEFIKAWKDGDLNSWILFSY